MQPPKKQIRLKINFMLHPKFSVHILLSIVLNVLASAVIIGFSYGINMPVLLITPIGYITAILLYTLAENTIKIIVYRYLMKYVLMTFGLISYIIHVLLFFTVDRIYGVAFLFTGVEELLVFTLFFSVIRYILTHYYQRYRIHKMLKKG